MRISKEQFQAIKEILGGQEFLILIAIPDNVLKTRGQKGAGISGVDAVASMSRDAFEYVILAAAMAVVEGHELFEEVNLN